MSRRQLLADSEDVRGELSHEEFRFFKLPRKVLDLRVVVFCPLDLGHGPLLARQCATTGSAWRRSRRQRSFDGAIDPEPTYAPLDARLLASLDGLTELSTAERSGRVRLRDHSMILSA